MFIIMSVSMGPGTCHLPHAPTAPMSPPPLPNLDSSVCDKMSEIYREIGNQGSEIISTALEAPTDISLVNLVNGLGLWSLSLFPHMDKDPSTNIHLQ